MYRNFGVNENIGDSSSQYKGDRPTKDSNFLERYLSDNNVIKEGIVLETFMGGYVAHVGYGNGSAQAVWLGGLLGGMSGTSDISVMSAGTRVLVFTPSSGVSFILGAIPSNEVSDGFNTYEVESTSKDFKF